MEQTTSKLNDNEEMQFNNEQLEISFNPKFEWNVFEKASVKTLLRSYKGAGFNMMMTTQYNQVNIIKPVHLGVNETNFHFNIQLFNDFSKGNRSANIPSQTIHVYLNDDLTAITHMTMVTLL